MSRAERRSASPEDLPVLRPETITGFPAVPLQDWESRRPGGPANAVHADRAAGPAGLLQVLEASGALLVAMVRTTPSRVRAHHGHGASDPEGFAGSVVRPCRREGVCSNGRPFRCGQH
jgi:hypothetical protein